MGSWSVTSNPIVYGKQGRFINNSLQSRWPPLSFECQQKLTLPHTARKQKSFRSRKRKVKCLFLFDNECRRFWNWSKNKTKKRRATRERYDVHRVTAEWRLARPRSDFSHVLLHTTPSLRHSLLEEEDSGWAQMREGGRFFFFFLPLFCPALEHTYSKRRWWRRIEQGGPQEKER